MKVTVDIPEGSRLELRDGAYVIVEDSQKDVRDRIKTFEDAYKELDKRHDDLYYLIAEYDNRWTDSEELLAYLKLRIIVAALNEGWKPEFNGKKYRFFAWINIGHNDGVAVCVYSYDIPSYTYSYCGSRFAFKSRELAEYAGEQFKDLWIDYLAK